MKLLLLSLGLLAGGAAQAQYLHGGYLLDVPKGKPRYGVSFLWFEAGQFKELAWGCTGGDVDGGTYTQAGNRLSLHYDSWQQPPSTYAATPLAGDSTREALEMLVLDAKTRLPLEAIAVQSRPSPAVHHLTNEQGLVRIGCPGSLAATDTLVVSSYLNADYEPLRLPAHLAQGRRLTVWLAPKSRRRPSGSVQEFVIQSLTPRMLALRFADPDLAAYLMRYTRVSAAQAQRFLQNAE